MIVLRYGRLALEVTLTRTARSHLSTSQLSARCPACVALGGMAYTYCRITRRGGDNRGRGADCVRTEKAC